MEPRKRNHIQERGRVLIPASFRTALELQVGDEIELRIENNEIRISTVRSRLARSRQRLRKFIKPGRSLSEELIAERREAAKLE
jgi:antitoxin PrlF